MVDTVGWKAPKLFCIPDMEVANEYKWPTYVYSSTMIGYEIVICKILFMDEPHYSLFYKIMAKVEPSFQILKRDNPKSMKEPI